MSRSTASSADSYIKPTVAVIGIYGFKLILRNSYLHRRLDIGVNLLYAIGGDCGFYIYVFARTS